jgi:hypothetical protein
MRKFMKMSGGGDIDQMDLNAFMVQAREYEQGGDAMDMIVKVLNTLGHTHPFHTVRAAELQRWVEGGDYDRILRGEYPRRGSEEDKRPVSEDFADAGKYYSDQMKETMEAVSGVARKAKDAFSSAFSKGTDNR